MVEGQVTPFSNEVTSASTKAGPLVLSLIQYPSLHLLDPTAVCSFGPLGASWPPLGILVL